MDEGRGRREGLAGLRGSVVDAGAWLIRHADDLVPGAGVCACDPGCREGMDLRVHVERVAGLRGSVVDAGAWLIRHADDLVPGAGVCACDPGCREGMDLRVHVERGHFTVENTVRYTSSPAVERMLRDTT